MDDKLKFRTFDDTDWLGWGGCTVSDGGPDPRILEVEMKYTAHGNITFKGSLTAVIDDDGPMVMMFDTEGDLIDSYMLEDIIKEDHIEDFLAKVFEIRHIDELMEKYDLFFRKV